MKKMVPNLKKFATATSFIATCVYLTFERLIIKSSFGQDSFQIWKLMFDTNTSNVINAYSIGMRSAD